MRRIAFILALAAVAALSMAADASCALPDDGDEATHTVAIDGDSGGWRRFIFGGGSGWYPVANTVLGSGGFSLLPDGRAVRALGDSVHTLEFMVFNDTPPMPGHPHPSFRCTPAVLQASGGRALLEFASPYGETVLVGYVATVSRPGMDPATFVEAVPHSLGHSASVSFDINGGEGFLPPPKHWLLDEEQEEVLLRLPIGHPDAQGGFFLGWARDKGASTPDHVPGELVSIPRDAPVTFFAVYAVPPAPVAGEGYAFHPPGHVASIITSCPGLEWDPVEGALRGTPSAEGAFTSVALLDWGQRIAFELRVGAMPLALFDLTADGATVTATLINPEARKVSWTVRDADGSVVRTGIGFPSVSWTLPDGEYTVSARASSSLTSVGERSAAVTVASGSGGEGGPGGGDRIPPPGVALGAAIALLAAPLFLRRLI